MKYLGLILVVVVALMASEVLAKRIHKKDSQLKQSRERRGFNDKFRNFLEHARIILREGNSTLGIPVLDPFVSKKKAIKIDKDFINGTIEASNFNVTGVSGYRVDKAEIAVLSRKLTVGLTFPRINSKGSYKLDVIALKNIKAFGNGRYTLALTNLSFESTVWIGLTPDVHIKKMETQISLGNLALSATGLFNDEDMSKVISEVISDAAPQILEDYQKEITSTVHEIVMRVVNKYLKGKSIADIIEILG